MERNLFKFIWKFSSAQQITTLILIAVSFPFLYYSLDLPKTIVNKAIDAPEGKEAFEMFGFDLLGFHIEPMEFTQLQYLGILCTAFLLLVLINGGFKFVINKYKGVMAERLLRRIRYILMARSLRFPLPQFQKMSSGEVVTMITAEVEPLGGFFGDAYALLAFQGGTFITIMFFMFMQDPWLGLAAFASIPIQGYIIPKLQKKVNLLGKRRVKEVRVLSNRISEVVTGIEDVHAQDQSKFVLAGVGEQLGKIFWIRFEIYQRKFFMKFLNNFIGQLTPFFFFSVGGYLVIQGDLTLGSLVAALAAYKDLASPWKELLNYYQRMADAKIKYEQLQSQFVPAGMLPEEFQGPAPETMPNMAAPLTASGITLIDEDGLRPVDNASFTLPPSSATLLTSASGAGREAIAQLTARLLMPSRGKISVGDVNLAEQHETVIGQYVGYLKPEPSFFSGDVASNLFLGLQHLPPDHKAEEMDEERQREYDEALASGNSPYNAQMDWVNYPLSATDGYESLRVRTTELLEMVELDHDFYEMGLRQPTDPHTNPKLAEGVLEARLKVREYLASRGMEDLVRNFDFNEYNDYSPVSENILFGRPLSEDFHLDNLAKNPLILNLLKEFDLHDRFLEIGLRCAETMVELFRDIPAGHAFFEQFSFVDEELLPELKIMVNRAAQDGIESLQPDQREILMSLPFKLVPQRHRLDLINHDLQLTLVELRKKLHSDHSELLNTKIQPFDAEHYNEGLSIQDNILFGRVAYGRADANEKVMEALLQITNELGLRATIIRTAFNFQVGIGGSRLSAGQRQKLALVRNMLKRPRLMVVNDGLNSLDAETQARLIERTNGQLEGLSLFWISGTAPAGIHFDQQLELKAGQVMTVGEATADIPAETPAGEEAETESQDEMAMSGEAQVLQNLPLFANLDASRLKFLAFTAERKTYVPNDVLFQQGDFGDAAYVILSGEADVVLDGDNGDENILFRLGANQLVGELALLCDTPRTATIRAVTKMSALKLNKDVFTELARQDAHFAFEMTRDLSNRLIKTTAELSARNNK